MHLKIKVGRVRDQTSTYFAGQNRKETANKDKKDLHIQGRIQWGGQRGQSDF